MSAAPRNAAPIEGPSPNHPGDGESVHLLFLDGIRGLAALYVVCHHFLAWSAEGVSPLLHLAVAWSSFGHSAVVMFIVVSGFSLMMPVARDAAHRLRGGIPNYFQRRARRILPAYFAALVFSVLAVVAKEFLQGRGASWWQAPDLSAGSVISHLLLVQNWNAAWNGSINMALWSVATEWQIYFLFPFVLLPVWRWRKFLCLPVGLVIGLLPGWLLPSAVNLDWACPWFVALFAAGMLLASMFTGRHPLLSRSAPWLACAAVFGALTVATKGWLRGDEYAWLRDLMMGGLCVAAIALCLVGLGRKSSRGGFVLGLLQSRVCAALGAVSYSLYLTHCAILVLFQGLTPRLGLSPDQALLLRAVVGLPVCIGVAFLFFRFFEKPFLSRKRAAAVAPLFVRNQPSPASPGEAAS